MLGSNRLHACCSLALVLVLALVSTARAQGGVIDMGGLVDEQAKAHFKVGKSLYESGRFAEAAVEWEQAYALSKKEQILYNLYVAYRDASDWSKAIDALRRYLDAGEVDPATRVNLRARLQAMEEANSRVSAAQPQMATTQAPVEPEPEPAPPAVAPAPSPVTTPSRVPTAAGGSWLPYVLVAGGSALIAGGVVAGIVASNKISDIEHTCPNDLCPARYDLGGNRHDARVWRTLTLAFVGTGVVTVSVGAVLLLAGQGGAEARDSASPAPVFACGPRACLGGMRGRF
jgi:hypothetical protein